MVSANDPISPLHVLLNQVISAAQAAANSAASVASAASTAANQAIGIANQANNKTRAGNQVVASGTGQVTFGVSFPDIGTSDYSVSITPNSGRLTQIAASGRTPTGFTVTLNRLQAASYSIDWIVVKR